jgi:hypothetical protein
MAETDETGIFAEALRNASDITDDYYDDARLRDRLKPAEPLDKHLEGMRALMQKHGGIQRIADADRALQAHVEQLHAEGGLAAVDGTDAISLTEYEGQSVYAVGVIAITTRTVEAPRIRETSARVRLTKAGPLPENDLLTVIDHLDRFAEDRSWALTFREHEERREALRMITEAGSQLVLIDGPLYTQNLLTQTVACNGVLTEMLAQHNRLIGFLKEIRSAKLLHWAGMALHAGEYWVIERWRHILEERFRPQGAQHSRLLPVHTWLASLQHANQQWLRVVYRIRGRTFAFECHPDLVPTGIAILNSPIVMTDAVNHELPFLLETADRIVRAQMTARTKSENLISDSPHYANLQDEREFR